MTDDIPEDANIYFCALKKSVYVTRDVIKSLANYAIFSAICVIIAMVITILVIFAVRYSKPILNFVFWVPIPVYLIGIFVALVYSYSLVWCYNRNRVLEMKKICIEHGVDPEIFERLSIDGDRIYINFDRKFYNKNMESEVANDFGFAYSGETIAVASIELDKFVNKLEFFRRNNISVTTEVSRCKADCCGWK